jgi:hypothetical protein
VNNLMKAEKQQTANPTQCDTDMNNRKGGFIKLNDRIFAVHTTPRARADHRAVLSDYASLGEFKCAEYNATNYWRIASYPEAQSYKTSTLMPAPFKITETSKSSRLCSCWYTEHPFTAELFCKPSTGACADMTELRHEQAAVLKEYVC